MQKKFLKNDEYPPSEDTFFIANNIENEKGEYALDIGSGSGILSIAALKLGAARAFGLEIEPDALPTARENAANNNVSDRFTIALGSVDEVKAGVFAIQKAELVLANILTPILVAVGLLIA